MARGHHHRPEHHPHSDHPVHHMRARGGKAEAHEEREHEEHEGKMHDYTADSEVVEEAEGKARRRGGRGRKHAAGGAVKLRRGGHVPEHEKEEHERAAGGAVPTALARGGHPKKHVEGEGHKTKHRRLDRPGRKRGGGVGATLTPLSSAARTHQGGAHKADNDELAE